MIFLSMFSIALTWFLIVGPKLREKNELFFIIKYIKSSVKLITVKSCK